MIYVLLYVTLCPFKYCNHLDGEERAGCFAYFVFLVSRDGWRLFLAVPWGCLRFVIVVFPDHTHLLFLIVSIPGLCHLSYFKFLIFFNQTYVVGTQQNSLNETLLSLKAHQTYVLLDIWENMYDFTPKIFAFLYL